MPRRIYDRYEVRRLVDVGAQLAEVLPRPEYDSEHIAGAVHVPLKKLDETAARDLDKAKPVIAYCHDFL